MRLRQTSYSKYAINCVSVLNFFFAQLISRRLPGVFKYLFRKTEHKFGNVTGKNIIQEILSISSSPEILNVFFTKG